MHTIHDFRVKILSEENILSLEETLRKNRNITEENFFLPDFSHLHDPFLLPDMKQAVRRILEARERHERIIVFGDYDVD
jgi:single-stranded-DNA-specific exonuclease